jgi:acylphosphatase
VKALRLCSNEEEEKGRLAMGKNVRAQVIISGRVQGVFFRAETQRAAERIGVNGWVRNLPDGNVEALFEGPHDRVEEAIRWCHKGSPAAKVGDVQVDWKDYTGEFDRFKITY